jgi:hypothetical protein
VIAAGAVHASPGFSFPVPVPERLTVCVLPATPFELSVTVRVALRLPVAAGVNVTPIVHDAFAANWPPSVLQVSEPVVSAKSPGSAPVNEMAKVRTLLLAFTKVTVCAELVVVFA